ncbi:hypothetical protein HRI_000105000 [Hibiscus trionum]|uniref:Aerolysin-like C-terminal domain-containing protein n=1 Tax=Hibiscus trionum TaxID=183268 RepID=A0A9W7GRJ1_HIBTR|nr:hypothetical protein HRI_000105000 [Hibiscus trionum]
MVLIIAMVHVINSHMFLIIHASHFSRFMVIPNPCILLQHTLSVKLSYEEVKTTTWKSNLSLKLAMKATASFRIPLILNGKIEISSEVQSVTEWGKTTTTTTLVEVVHQVVVPAMTKVRVDLVATKGFCDVPFTYTRKDTLYDGNIVTKTERSTYTGSNYYSNDFVVREEKL